MYKNNHLYCPSKCHQFQPCPVYLAKSHPHSTSGHPLEPGGGCQCTASRGVFFVLHVWRMSTLFAISRGVYLISSHQARTQKHLILVRFSALFTYPTTKLVSIEGEHIWPHQMIQVFGCVILIMVRVNSGDFTPNCTKLCSISFGKKRLVVTYHRKCALTVYKMNKVCICPTWYC